ncbi:MAG: TerC family protein [Thermoanaerobaculia bacterium]
MDWISDPQAWIALVTLTVLEIVLGVDNIIFISILTGKLPEKQRQPAQLIGLGLAMGMRILLLVSLAWIIRLTEPLFSVFGNDISGRDLILILGGLFLLGKATHEIHHKLEGVEGSKSSKVKAAFGAILVQVALLDIVFSLDSVITAVGMVRQVPIMVIAIVIAVGFMMLFARPLSDFVERHPTVKMLALAFLLLIGMALVADGLDHHIPKGYIYFAMGFSVFVEMLNLRLKAVHKAPVNLRDPIVEE